jgi:hypothetical protein
MASCVAMHRDLLSPKELCLLAFTVALRRGRAKNISKIDIRHFAIRRHNGDFIMRIELDSAHPLNLDRVNSTGTRTRSSIDGIVATTTRSA